MEQPQVVLARALLERRTQFADRTFYDVSTWTLPLAMGAQVSELNRKNDLRELLGAPVVATAHSCRRTPVRSGRCRMDPALGRILRTSRSGPTPRRRRTRERRQRPASCFDFRRSPIVRTWMPRHPRGRANRFPADVTPTFFDPRPERRHRRHRRPKRTNDEGRRPGQSVNTTPENATTTPRDGRRCLKHRCRRDLASARFSFRIGIADDRRQRSESNTAEGIQPRHPRGRVPPPVGASPFTLPCGNLSRTAAHSIASQGAARWTSEKLFNDPQEESTDSAESNSSNESEGDLSIAAPVRDADYDQRRAINLISGAIFQIRIDTTHPLGLWLYDDPRIAVFKNNAKPTVQCER